MAAGLKSCPWHSRYIPGCDMCLIASMPPTPQEMTENEHGRERQVGTWQRSTGEQLSPCGSPALTEREKGGNQHGK